MHLHGHPGKPLSVGLQHLYSEAVGAHRVTDSRSLALAPEPTKEMRL